MEAIILLGAPGAGKGTVAERLTNGTRTTSTCRPATCCGRR